MKKVQTIAVIVGLLFSLTAGAQNKQMSDGHKIDPLPRDLEIQLALSALPPHLRDNATVSVLNPEKGFEVARQGTNGFHALVARTGDDTFRGSWAFLKYRDDILYEFPLMKRAPRHKCRSSLTLQRCRLKTLRLQN